VVASVHTATQDKVLLLYVSTGFAICARKETIVNTYTSMTCPKCLNVISSVNLVRSVLLNGHENNCIPTCVGECHNKDCPYQHIDPESKIKDCFWYDRGYCKHGRLLMILVTF